MPASIAATPDSVLVPFCTQLLDSARHFEQLEHPRAPSAARETALGTAGTLTESSRFGSGYPQAIHVERLWSICFCARRTIEPDEPLRDHSKNHAGCNAPIDTEFGQPGDRSNGIVGMERRENQMSGHRCMDRSLRGFGIANLADQNHVGILTQDGAKHARKRQAGALVSLDLRDAVDFVLNRILDRNDVHWLVAKLVDQAVERGRLAASGWPDHEENAL